MGAALALLVLLAGSVFIVRIASVLLRLTGLPDNVARFQSISALTGAGFTTSESEAIVNFPVRRRVIVALMLLGNLGLVSVASTFIVALANSTDSRLELFQQIGLFAVVAAVIAVFMLSKTIDRILCGAVERLMRKFLRRRVNGFDVLCELPSGLIIARHLNLADRAVVLSEEHDVLVGAVILEPQIEGGQITLSRERSLICAAMLEQHQSVALAISRSIESRQ